MSDATSHGWSEAAPGPEGGEREPRTAKPPRYPQPVTRTRAAPPHRPLGETEHTDIHEIAWGAHQVSPEHTRADTPRGCAHTGHDLNGG